MTEAQSRHAAKLETRAALIHAGLMEFFEHGLDIPSLDAICARAGYTRGAFYVHFHDRDEFVVAAMDTVLGAFLDTIIVADSEGDDLEETVLRFASALSEGHALIGERGSMRSHQLLDACTRSAAIRGRFIETLSEAIRRVERAALSARKADAVRADVASRPLAAVLVALALGLVQMIELGVSLNLDEIRATVLRLLSPAVAKRPPSPRSVSSPRPRHLRHGRGSG